MGRVIKSVIRPNGGSKNKTQFKTGIYEILHRPSKRRYVGSSIEVEKRLYFHVTQLNVGKHHCKYLQNVWNKYRGEGFEFYLLEECSKETLQINEQKHMDMESEYELMNLDPTARIAFGFKLSEETKRKISEKAKEVGATFEQRRMRSERARQQHLTGRIGYRPKAKKKFVDCKYCGKPFELERHPTTGGWRQQSICLDCKVKYKKNGGKKVGAPRSGGP